MEKLIEHDKIDICVKPQAGRTVSSDSLVNMAGYARALIVGSVVGGAALATATITLYKGQAAAWASATGTVVDTTNKQIVLTVGTSLVNKFAIDVDHYDIDSTNHYVGLLVETEASTFLVDAYYHRYDPDYRPVDNSGFDQV